MKLSRNTMQRNLILQSVRSLHHHPTADEVYQEVTRHCAHVSKGTVYRNLNLLSQRGEILKVEVPGGADHFDFNVSAHYHVYCRSCSGVYDIDVPSLDGIMDLVRDPGGFDLEGYQILFKGICPNCKEKENRKSS